MARRSASSSAVTSNSQSPPDAAPEVARTHRDDSGDEFQYGNAKQRAFYERTKPLPFDPSLLPKGSRSLCSISLQSFWLGFALAFCALSTAYLTLIELHPSWRLTAFFGFLSLFHFLEFYTTARFNVPAARSSSFLLFNNGTAYNIAHSLAALEILLSIFVLPNAYLEYPGYSPVRIALGLTLVAVGQTVRSVAMAQAGTNFNHTPQMTKKEDHELVTHGLYGYLRHPSYFGFFWWALGTQVLVGNKVCLAGYTFALWNFFNRRIISKYRESLCAWEQ